MSNENNGLFGQYADNGADDELYGEDGEFEGGGGKDYNYIQRPLNAILEVDNVKTGVSGNEGSDTYGHPFFVLEASIFEIKSQGEHTPRDPSQPPTRPELTPGDGVQFFQKLPMTEVPPSKWKKSDRYAVRDVKACVAAIYGVDEAVMDLQSVDKTAENSGERVRGMLVGVKSEISKQDGSRFANLSFYTVYEDGNPSQPLSPEETREVMNAA